MEEAEKREVVAWRGRTRHGSESLGCERSKRHRASRLENSHDMEELLSLDLKSHVEGAIGFGMRPKDQKKACCRSVLSPEA